MLGHTEGQTTDSETGSGIFQAPTSVTGGAREEERLEENVRILKGVIRLLSLTDCFCRNSGDEDVSAFCETPDCLLSENGNRSSHEHSASTAECTRCHRSHCPCDQCSISHLIACGLTSAHVRMLIRDSRLFLMTSSIFQDVELPDCESLSLLDDLNDSSNSSCSE